MLTLLTNQGRYSPEKEGAGPDQGEGLAEVVEVVGERGDDDGEVAAHEIHAEQEEGDAGGPDLGVHDLHDDGEEDGEPGLGKQIVGDQGEHGACTGMVNILRVYYNRPESVS